MAVITHRDLFAPSFYRVWNDVLAKKYPEIWLAGGRGCVSGDTLLETPNGKIAIRDFHGGEVISSVDGLPKACPACRPQRHSIQKLYRVLSENGYDISVTDEHLFLVPGNNWKMTRELSVGDPICTVDSFGLIVESKVKSIEYDKTDYYYDLNVDGSHNYIAHGFVNHNSTKSSFISTAIILLMEANPDAHCCCFRRYAANLADSVYSQFEFTLTQKLKPLASHWVFKKSPLKIVNVNTGQQIVFRGLDDPQKVKSLKAPFGYWAFTWYEEASEVEGIEEIRNINQSLHRGGHYFQTFLSYNPPETSSNWINYESTVPQIVDGKLYRKVYRSDYRSVPREWLGNNFFIEADLLRRTNERAYRHEYLGEVTGNGGAIFPNVKPLSMSDAMISQFDHRHFGLDFGFAIDPAAWIALHYDKTRRDIYIYDEIYDIEMTNMTLAKLIKQKDMGFDYLMCDSAEPKSIAELESLGVNALPTTKGPDSVRFSTKFLQSLCNIYIDPIRCPNAFREFSQYEYEKNKMGQFISKFPDKNNHAIDACVIGDTIVHTPSGNATIRSLAGKNGKLFGYDSDGIIRAVDFTNCRLTRRDTDIRHLGFEGGIQIKCTADHKILTPEGYVEAGDIGPFSKVVTWDGIRNSTFNIDGGKSDVYDLEVPSTHNFIVNGGLVIHNCRYALMDEAISAGLF